MILPGATGDVVTGRWIETKCGRALLANRDGEIGAKVSNLGDPSGSDRDVVTGRWIEAKFGRPLLANHDNEIGAKVSNLGDPSGSDRGRGHGPLDRGQICRPLLANHDNEIGAKVSNLGDPPWEDGSTFACSNQIFEHTGRLAPRCSTTLFSATAGLAHRPLRNQKAEVLYARIIEHAKPTFFDFSGVDGEGLHLRSRA